MVLEGADVCLFHAERQMENDGGGLLNCWAKISLAHYKHFMHGVGLSTVKFWIIHGASGDA